MAEHARIARFFAPLAAKEPGSFMLQDDAAVLSPPPGQTLVITTDSVIEGIHVLLQATPQQFAQKLMRRNLSDLAAMGADPWRYTLNLHTPHDLAEDWFAAFAAALAAEQQQFGLTLIGGDSTSGEGAIHTTMTCIGLLDAAPNRRNAAAIGDDIYVSGTLGDAAFALHALQHRLPLDAALEARYHCPTPRLALGKMLRSIASSAIDISDGLMADLTQICTASNVGARIQRDAIPLHEALARNDLRWQFSLSGGDDYELCFTAAKTQRTRISQLAEALQLPLTRIGEIVRGTDVELLDAAGNSLPLTHKGWEH